MEPKQPEDVYKTHLVDGRSPAAGAAVDSARQNLANTFVNAFVNAGFGQDKLVTVSSEASTSGASGAAAGGGSTHWIFKNRDHGKTSATASVGLITMWDVEGGLPQVCGCWGGGGGGFQGLEVWEVWITRDVKGVGNRRLCALRGALGRCEAGSDGGEVGRSAIGTALHCESACFGKCCLFECWRLHAFVPA